MQGLMMDGVRRTSGVAAMPQTLVLGVRKPKVTPLAPLTTPAIRTAGRIDGIRPLAASPRELLEAMRPAVPEVLPPRSNAWVRPTIAFSIVATTLVIGALAGVRLVPQHASAARANEATPTIAATPDPAAASAAAAAAALSQQTTGIQTILNDFVAAHGSNYSLYVKDLKTGATAQVGADRVMLSASLYKLFVAQRIYQMIDAGTLTYGQAAGGGSGDNIQDCLTVMINISDNTCGRALGTIVGWNKQDSSLKASGYSGTTLGDQVTNAQMTNARDVGRLLEQLYNGTLMAPSTTDNFIGLLKAQRVNDRLPTGLPAGTVIAHKTGDLSGYTHDAGIIYGAKTDFEVVVMSGPWASPESSKPAFGTLAGQLNSFFNN